MKFQKRIGAALLACVLLLSASAFASSPKTLFKIAKNTLKCLAKGDYETIVESLPVSGMSPSASEWENLAERALSLGSGKPQTKYAVAYRHGSQWRVAIPVSTPDSGDVPVFYLDSEDGSTVCGYGCSSWSETVSEYKSSDSVVWNEEYLGSAATAETDDF